MNALEKVENAKDVALADIDEARARKAADRFGATAYTDYHDMFAQEELQAVYVCVPPLAHTDAEVLAAERKLGLFVEKPVALTMDNAREIERAIQANGVLSAVGYHWRAYDVTDRVKEALADRTIGMHMGYWVGWLPDVWWWRRMDGSGGQMVEQTTHIIDLARYYAGEITRVYAAYALRTSGDLEGLDVADVGTMTVHFESGAIGHIANSCMVSSGGTVGLNIVAKDLVVEQRSGTIKLVEGNETTEVRTKVNPTLVEDQTFIDAVESGNGSRIRSPYSDAVRTLAVSLAANRSAERREAVEVAELLV